MTLSLLRDEDGALVERVLVVQDVTERQQLEEHLRRQALHDPADQPPGRRGLLRDRLTHAPARTARRGTQVAVLFLNVNAWNRRRHPGHTDGNQFLVEAPPDSPPGASGGRSVPVTSLGQTSYRLERPDPGRVLRLPKRHDTWSAATGHRRSGRRLGHASALERLGYDPEPKPARPRGSPRPGAGESPMAPGTEVGLCCFSA